MNGRPLFGGGLHSCELWRRQAGGSYQRGVDPEYGWYTDRDHDGLVCET